MFKHGFPPEWSTFKKLIWLVGSGIAGAASGIWKTVTGALIHITDALASPVQALSIAIEPQQSGSGDPSPTNVRPITGWTGANITHTGANLLYANIVQGGIGSNGSLVDNAKRCRTGLNEVLSNHEYTASVESNKKILAVHFYSGTTSGTWISRTTNTTNTITFTTPSTANYCRLLVSNSNDTTNITPESITSLMLAYGEESKPYEASQGTTYPISWQTEAGTIYRGNVDIISGDITSRCAKDSWDNNSSITLSETGTYCCRYKITSSKTSNPPSPYTAAKAETLGFRCNMAKFVSSSTWDEDGQYGYYISNSGGTKNFFFTCPKSFASTANELKAQLQTTPLEICYPLATSTTASIEGTEISTLAGENNIWADCGDTTLTYQAVPQSAFSDETDKGMADYMTLTE